MGVEPQIPGDLRGWNRCLGISLPTGSGIAIGEPPPTTAEWLIVDELLTPGEFFLIINREVKPVKSTPLKIINTRIAIGQCGYWILPANTWVGKGDFWPLGAPVRLTAEISVFPG